MFGVRIFKRPIFSRVWGFRVCSNFLVLEIREYKDPSKLVQDK